MHLKLSRYSVVTPPIVDPLDGVEKRVLFGTRQTRSFVLETPQWNLLEAGRAEPVVQAHPGSGRRHRLHLEG